MAAYRAVGSSKYHNRRVSLEGLTFDSQAEASRYRELLILEQAGEIIGLRVHPRIELVPAFVDRYCHKQRAIVYVGDFGYWEPGKEDTLVVEDVKGVETEGFRLKRRLVLWRRRDIDLRVLHVGKLRASTGRL